MTLLYAVELQPGQTRFFSVEHQWRAVSIETTAITSLESAGTATALTRFDVDVVVSATPLSINQNVILDLGRFQGEHVVQVRVDDWMRQPVQISLRGLELDHESEAGRSHQSQIDLVPLPDDSGVIVKPGFAAYDAATATRSTENETFTETYSTPLDKFWAIGAKSVERFDSGRIRFGSGVGRGVYGLAPQFESVNYADLHWAFYVESSSVLKILEPRDGRISLVWEGAWNPAEELAIKIDDGQIFYQVKMGDGWSTLYRSLNQLSTLCYFCAVLGPLAFIYGATHEG